MFMLTFTFTLRRSHHVDVHVEVYIYVDVYGNNFLLNGLKPLLKPYLNKFIFNHILFAWIVIQTIFTQFIFDPYHPYSLTKYVTIKDSTNNPSQNIH